MSNTRFCYTDALLLTDDGKKEQMYEQLAALLRRDGTELAGRVIMPERAASEALGINRSAVHRVYEKLVADGLLERQKGARLYRIAAFDKIRCGQCIGLVLPYAMGEYFADTGCLNMRMRLYCGIADRAAENDLGILPLTLPPPDSKKSDIEIFCRDKLNSLAGLIHLGNRNIANDAVLDTLWQNRSIPQVCLLSQNNHAHCGSVSFDHVSALQSEARHLLDNGHRKLALFSPDFHNLPGLRYVLQSVADAAKIFREYGMDVRPEWCFEVMPNDNAALAKELDKFLSLPEHPRAIWCRNDRMASNILKLLHERGKAVPADYSIVSIDNSAEGAESDPPLTTLQLPFYNCGREAVDMLLDIRRTGNGAHQRIRHLPATLIVRGSSGPNKEYKANDLF